MSEPTFTFNWQDESGGFLRWLVPTVIGRLHGANHPLYADLAVRTDAWRSVKLGITVNGVAVPTEEFIKQLQEAIHHEAKLAAEEFLGQQSHLNVLVVAVRELQEAVAGELYRRAHAVGLRPGEDE